MAQFAIGKPCPGCNSLLTYAGNQNDANLVAQCFVCGLAYLLKNTEYVGLKVCSECGKEATLVAPPTPESPAVVVGAPVDNPVLPEDPSGE